MTRVLDVRVMPWITAAAAALIALAAWQAGYRPAASVACASAARTEALSSEIAALEGLLLSGGGRPAWEQRQQHRLAALRTRLPQQEQVPAVLNAVDAVFRQGSLALRNMTQGNIELVDRGGPVAVPSGDGAVAYQLPLMVMASGRYHALADAIDRLTRAEFPALVSVEDVQLRRVGEGPEVDATVTLMVYLAGAPR